MRILGTLKFAPQNCIMIRVDAFVRVISDKFKALKLALSRRDEMNPWL